MMSHENVDTAPSFPGGVRLAYRPNEAAELIGISRMSLYQLLASREIPSRLHGRKRLILAEDLQAWLKGLREW